MPYQQYNRIPVPEVQREEKKPISQLRSELSFVNAGTAEKKKGSEKHRKPSNVQPPEKRKTQKIHPGYEKPYDRDRQERLEQRKRAEYMHRKQLAEKRRRAEKVRQREIAASKRLKAEAKREKELEYKKRNYYEKQRRKLNAERNRRYSRELSAEENARIRIKKERKKKRRIETARVFAARAIASAILGILLFLFGFTIHMISLNRYASQSTLIYARVGENERYKAQKDNIFVLGEQISQLCGFTVLESESGVKYISTGQGNEYVSFSVGIPSASVNGSNVSLNSSPYIEDEKLYIPLSFFEEYCLGLDVLYDEESNTVSISRQISNEKAVENNNAAPIYEPVTFTLKDSGVLTRIDEKLVP